MKKWLMLLAQRPLLEIDICEMQWITDDRVRIYKNNNGYLVLFNCDIVETYPLSKSGFDRAIDRFWQIVNNERAKYL